MRADHRRRIVRLNLIVIAVLVYFWRHGTPTRSLVITGITAVILIDVLYPFVLNKFSK